MNTENFQNAVLGLSFGYHDSAAAIVYGDNQIAAAAEERFSRIKHDNGFPSLAIDFCLTQAGIKSISDLDAIIFYEKPANKLARVVENYVATWPRSLASFITQFPDYLKNRANVEYQIRKLLPEYKNEVLFSRHHLSHAAAGYYLSPFTSAAVLSIDAIGEYESTAISVANGLNLRMVKSINFPHSLGMLYSAVTAYLGFEVNEGEWKTMGLAAYGSPKYYPQFKKLIQLHEDGSFSLEKRYFAFPYSRFESANRKKWTELFGFPPRAPEAKIEKWHHDLAASAQKIFEEHVVALAKHAQAITHEKNLVLSGGAALNGMANRAVEQAGIFEQVWVPPAPGDDGAALGAALIAHHFYLGKPRCQPARGSFLGPAYERDLIARFVSTEKLNAEELPEEQMAAAVSNALSEGAVVAVFNGPMEFGPRALGSRSILADARNPRMKFILNEKVKFREGFRPFAPTTLAEHAHEFFDVRPGEDFSFMTKIVKVREEKRNLIPAVTHEDGTARLQTVSVDQSPFLRKVLLHFFRVTGVPVLVNTSFNLRGEPIVSSPEEAYDSFRRSNIDLLVLGDFLIRRQLSSKASPNTASEPVADFYWRLPFNSLRDPIYAAEQIRKKNNIKQYPPLHRYLQLQEGDISVLDVGCGSGWFLNSCAQHYRISGLGIDSNERAVSEARSILRYLKNPRSVEFSVSDLFSFSPGREFDIVNSLGVLHHTGEFETALVKAASWTKRGGYLHLGLYHKYGRRPFLRHFETLKASGLGEKELFEIFSSLRSGIFESRQLLSWFQDQALHPLETQHTLEEVTSLLTPHGFQLEATSINSFSKIRGLEELYDREPLLERLGEKRLRHGQYYPGFFTVWMRRL